MAEHKYDPNSYILSIDAADGTAYAAIVCLENWTFPKGRAEIDSKSMCGPDKSVGNKELGPIGFDGQLVSDPDADRIGLAGLEVLFANKTQISWQITPVSPITGDITYTGEGCISKLDVSSATDTRPKMAGQITVYGDYVATPTT